MILADFGNESCPRSQLNIDREPVQKVQPKGAMSPCEVARSHKDPSQMSHDVITALQRQNQQCESCRGQLVDELRRGREDLAQVQETLSSFIATAVSLVVEKCGWTRRQSAWT